MDLDIWMLYHAVCIRYFPVVSPKYPGLSYLTEEGLTFLSVSEGIQSIMAGGMQKQEHEYSPIINKQRTESKDGS